MPVSSAVETKIPAWMDRLPGDRYRCNRRGQPEGGLAGDRPHGYDLAAATIYFGGAGSGALLFGCLFGSLSSGPSLRLLPRSRAEGI